MAVAKILGNAIHQLKNEGEDTELRAMALSLWDAIIEGGQVLHLDIEQ